MPLRRYIRTFSLAHGEFTQNSAHKKIISGLPRYYWNQNAFAWLKAIKEHITRGGWVSLNWRLKTEAIQNGTAAGVKRSVYFDYTAVRRSEQPQFYAVMVLENEREKKPLDLRRWQYLNHLYPHLLDNISHSIVIVVPFSSCQFVSERSNLIGHSSRIDHSVQGKRTDIPI